MKHIFGFAQICLLCPMVFADTTLDWPQFRGPDGQGSSSAARAPIDWTEEDIAWKSAIPGKGWSSPIVADGMVWVTTAIEKEPAQVEQSALPEGVEKGKMATKSMATSVELRLIGVSAESGKIEVSKELFNIEDPDPIHQLNSFASPTPVLDANSIYCHFGTYGTVCIDRATGEEKWRKQLPLDHGTGPGSSPALCDDLLILICDGVDVQYVTALDKRTGKEVWKVNRPPMRAETAGHRKAYSTPLVIESKQGKQILAAGAQWMVSYEPLTGKELWRVDHGSGFSLVPRPVFVDETVYFCTGYSSSELWAVDVNGSGDVSESHVHWVQDKRVSHKPSPVIVGDEIYVLKDSGMLSCIDRKTGMPHWVERVKGNYSASPLFVAGHLYLGSHEGDIVVIKPGSSFEEVARHSLEGKIMASPAMLGSSFLVRTNHFLYRIDP